MLKIPLACFGTKNFEPLLIRFCSSLDSRYQVEYHPIDALIDPRQGGGRDIWLKKVDILLNTIKSNSNSPYIIMADIDIQIYDKFFDEIDELVRKTDMLFQQENDHTDVNIGIIACKTTKNIISFWESVNDRIINSNRWDQKVVNDLIFELAVGKYMGPKLEIGVLPRKFWNWSSGRATSDIVCHHSNCTSVLEEKWRQMDLIQEALGKKSVFPHFNPNDLNGEWQMIRLGDKEPNTISLFSDGSVSGTHEHENERKWKLANSVFQFYDQNDRLSGYADTYYKDEHNNKELLVGKFMDFNNINFYKQPFLFALYRDF